MAVCTNRHRSGEVHFCKKCDENNSTMDYLNDELSEQVGIAASLRAELEEAKAQINELAPWSCVDCGPNIKIDEAGCCAMCGRDASKGGGKG